MPVALRSATYEHSTKFAADASSSPRSLFINTALLLWSFKITEDPMRPIDTLTFKEGIITVPQPFAAHFEPRHANLRELIDADDLGFATLIAADREL